MARVVVIGMFHSILPSMKIKSIITSAALALGVSVSASAASFTFSGNSDGTIGNSVAPSSSSGAGAVTVSATAFAYYNNTVSTRAVGQYGGGLGVNNSNNSPSDTGSPAHTVDNVNGVDMVLFSFSQQVTFTNLSLGYVDTDSDFRYWVGGAGSTAASLFGTGTGGTAVNGGSSAASYGISGSGTYLLVSADKLGYTAGTNGYFNYQTWQWVAGTSAVGSPDQFKINVITFTTNSNVPGTPDAGSTVALLGLALAGLAFAKRRFAV